MSIPRPYLIEPIELVHHAPAPLQGMSPDPLRPAGAVEVGHEYLEVAGPVGRPRDDVPLLHVHQLVDGLDLVLGEWVLLS